MNSLSQIQKTSLRNIRKWFRGLTTAQKNDRILTLEQTRTVIHPILLTTTFLASAGLVLSVISTFYYAPKNGLHLTSSLVISGIATAIFVSLICIARRYPVLASLIFIGTLLFVSLQCAYTYGFVTPQAMLGIALSILGAGVLISTFSATLVFISSSIILIWLSYGQIQHTIPIRHWSNDAQTWGDTVLFLITFLVIHYLTNVFTKVHKRSFSRALTAERTMEAGGFTQENPPTSDMDEAIFELALIREKISTNYHDIANPISSISLGIESLAHSKALSESERIEIINSIEKNSSLANRLLLGMQQELNEAPVQQEWFSIGDALVEVKSILAYKLRREGVTITIKADHKVSLYGSRLSFNRIIKNLIINSAEAYRLVSCDEKKIVLELKNSDKQVLLTINDTAGGISKLTAKHIFSPRFTTKNGEGSGMGLGIVKKKIQKDFNGNIFIDSKGRKTTFTILISKNGTNISHSVIHPKRDALPKNIATV